MNFFHVKTLIKEFEGFRSAPYLDQGVPAIGYGHRILPDDPRWDHLTLADAEKLLDADLDERARYLASILREPVGERQFNALLDLLYNIGAGAFASSTLLEKLNAGDLKGAAQELLRWHHVNGADSPALLRRRQAEYALFTGANVINTEIVRYAGRDEYLRLDEVERSTDAGFTGIKVQCFDLSGNPRPDIVFEHTYPQVPTNSEHLPGVMKDRGDNSGAPPQPFVEFGCDPHTSQPDNLGRGPHNVRPWRIPGDEIKYMGSEHGGEHFLYRLVYHVIPAGSAPPPVEPPEPPGDYVERPTLKQLLIDLANKL